MLTYIKIIDGQSKTEHRKLDTYEFSQKSLPITSFQLILSGPNLDDTLYLQFVHLDLFGSFLFSEIYKK